MILIKLLNKKSDENKSEPKWETIRIKYWHPKIGDKIEGKLIQTTNKNNQRLYVIEQENKKRIRIWGKTYLNQLMEEIEEGDHIRITYNGLKETQNNRQMKKYNVERRIKYE